MPNRQHHIGHNHQQFDDDQHQKSLSGPVCNDTEEERGDDSESIARGRKDVGLRNRVSDSLEPEIEIIGPEARIGHESMRMS